MNKLTMNTEKLNHNMDLLLLKNSTRYVVLEDIVVDSIVFPQECFEIELVVLEGKRFVCHTILDIENVWGTLHVINENASTTSIQLGIRAMGENHLNIINKLIGNHIHSSIKIRIIGEENSHTILNTTGIILFNTHGNVFLEDVKYLFSDTSYIACMPLLTVESDDAEANHNVSMGCVSLEDLFYLKSKGMTSEKACDLIRMCFLKSMLGGENNEYE